MNWSDWEDYAAGMYMPTWSVGKVAESVDLLADPERFYEAATEMVRAWPTAARHNLDYMWSGRNAWIGQATCTYAHASPAGATRDAWGKLRTAQQAAANATAERVRDERERGTRGGQTLFAV